MSCFLESRPEDKERKEDQDRQFTPDLILTPGLDADRIKSYDNKKEIITYAALATVARAIVVVATVNTATVIAFSKSLLTTAAENSEQLLNFAKNPEIYASAAESLCEIYAEAGFLAEPILTTIEPQSPIHSHRIPYYNFVEVEEEWEQ